jgi:hypothetical protein
MKPKFFPTAAAACAPTTLAAVALALAGPGCGRVPLDQPDDAGRVAPAAVDAAPDLSAPDAPPPANDALPLAPPFATILRVTNVGAGNFTLYPEGSFAYGFMISGAAPFDQLTSVESPAFYCDCGRCAANGLRFCDSIDLICDDPPIVLAPGAHFDYRWDGAALVWLSTPPAESRCTTQCSQFLPVPAGAYQFSLVQSPRLGDTVIYSVDATLPSPNGIVEIAVIGS